MHVVIAGGGSAGHIEPALNTADALRRADPSIGITMLGTEKGLDTKLIPARGYELRLIPAVPLPRRPTPKLFTVPSRLLGTVKAARQVLDDVQADVVVGFGGYVALPAYLAARKRHVPIVVHEANLKPGLANRVGARFTSHVATGSPSIPMKNATCLGMPLRPTISGLDRAALRAEARQAFGLDPDRPTLFVTGGSQGARRLNRTMEASVEALRAAGVQVLHSYGDKNTLAVEQRPDAPPYVARPYLDRMDLAYAAADFALSRGGMMTCAEFAAVGLPAAYVPLPIGNGEQWLNARPVVDAGGGLLVDDAELTPEWLAENVIPLLVDAKRLAAMSEAALRFGIRDADDRMARLVFEAAGVAWPAGGVVVDTAGSGDASSERDEAESTDVVFVADLGGAHDGESDESGEGADSGSAVSDAEAAFDRFGSSAAADAAPAADAEWLVATDVPPPASGPDDDAAEPEPESRGAAEPVTASSTEWLVPTDAVEPATASAASEPQGPTMLATVAEVDTAVVDEVAIPAQAEVATVAAKTPARPRTTKPKAAEPDSEVKTVPKPRTRKKAEPAVEAAAVSDVEVQAAAVTPKPRTRKKAEPAVVAAASAAVEVTAPKPRTRKKAEPAIEAAAGTAAETVVPKPRTTRKKAEPATEPTTAPAADSAVEPTEPTAPTKPTVPTAPVTPKPRTRKKPDPAVDPAAGTVSDAAPKPRSRKKAEPAVTTQETDDR